MKRFILLYFSLTCLNTLWGTLLADSDSVVNLMIWYNICQKISKQMKYNEIYIFEKLVVQGYQLWSYDHMIISPYHHITISSYHHIKLSERSGVRTPFFNLAWCLFKITLRYLVSKNADFTDIEMDFVDMDILLNRSPIQVWYPYLFPYPYPYEYC